MAFVEISIVSDDPPFVLLFKLRVIKWMNDLVKGSDQIALVANQGMYRHVLLAG